MRAERRIKRKLGTLFLILSIGIFAYIYGFSQGQASVYTKASNDKKLMHMLYGEGVNK